MTTPEAGAPAPQRRVIAPRNWREQFLALLAETANVSHAAAQAKISLSHVYKIRREDRSFARAWQAALCEGYDNLEMALLNRLLTGESRDADGKKYDNATAFRLLTAHKDSASRERAQRENETEEEILASIDAKLAAMRAREKAATALLAPIVTGPVEPDGTVADGG